MHFKRGAFNPYGSVQLPVFNLSSLMYRAYYSLAIYQPISLVNLVLC